MDHDEGLDTLDAARVLLSLGGGAGSSEHQLMTDVSGVESEEPAMSGGRAAHNLQTLADAFKSTTGSTTQSKGKQQRITQKFELPTRLKVDWQDPCGRKLLSLVGKFSLIEALCCYDDIALYLTTQFLPPQDMLKLYCISKRFHWIVDSHLTTYVLSSARRWAPLAYRCGDSTQPSLPDTYSNSDITTLMPFHNFLYLCTEDPTGRTTTATAAQATVEPMKSKRSNAHLTTLERTAASFIVTTSTALESETLADTDATTTIPAPATVRHVPTFRYLFLLSYRAQTIHTILVCVYAHGHLLPPTIPAVLAKLWLTLDVPTTAMRLALFRNTRYWTNSDIRVLLMFCMKLDMLFSDPVDGRGETSLRECMMGQRTLSVLAGVLRRQECKTSLEMMKLYVRWKYKARPEHGNYSILGVPAEEVGCLSKEYWGEREGVNGVLMRPDECAMREARSRGMDIKKEVVEYLLWGYIDKRTLDDAKVGPGFGAGVDIGSAPH